MRKIEPNDIKDSINPKAKIGIGNACAEPQTLINALINNRNCFNDIELYGMIQFWTSRLAIEKKGSSLRLTFD